LNLRNEIGEAAIDGIGEPFGVGASKAIGRPLGRRDGLLDGCLAGWPLGESEGPIEG
jgi:hypothetical protein